MDMDDGLNLDRVSGLIKATCSRVGAMRGDNRWKHTNVQTVKIPFFHYLPENGATRNKMESMLELICTRVALSEPKSADTVLCTIEKYTTNKCAFCNYLYSETVYQAVKIAFTFLCLLKVNAVPFVCNGLV